MNIGLSNSSSSDLSKIRIYHIQTRDNILILENYLKRINHKRVSSKVQLS